LTISVIVLLFLGAALMVMMSSGHGDPDDDDGEGEFFWTDGFLEIRSLGNGKYIFIALLGDGSTTWGGDTPFLSDQAESGRSIEKDVNDAIGGIIKFTCDIGSEDHTYTLTIVNGVIVDIDVRP
jgi:hypothetical protein